MSEPHNPRGFPTSQLVRRMCAALAVLDGITTTELEQIAAAPGDAARLAQLATAADAAYRRAKEPK